MTCGIRLTPSENSIAIISDDGDFVYQAALSPADSYTVLLPQLAAAITDACSGQDANTPIGVCIQGHETTANGTIKSLHHSLLEGKTAEAGPAGSAEPAGDCRLRGSVPGQCRAPATPIFRQNHNLCPVFRQLCLWRHHRE